MQLNQNNLNKPCEDWAKKPISYQCYDRTVGLLIRDELCLKFLTMLKNRERAKFLKFSTVLKFYIFVQMEDNSSSDNPPKWL